MFFLKIIDDQDQELELTKDDYRSPIPKNSNGAPGRRTRRASPGEELLDFVNDELFPALKNLQASTKPGDRRRVVQDVFEDAYNYMKSGQLMRQVVNKINEIDFNNLDERQHFGDILRANPQRPAIGRQRGRILHAARCHRLHGGPHRPAAR